MTMYTAALAASNGAVSLPDYIAQKRRQFRRLRGITLTEVMMSLGVFAAVIGIAVIAYAVVGSSNKTNQFMQEITTLTDLSNQMTAGQSDLSALSAATLAGSGLVPKRWVTGATSGAAGTGLISPFGAAITITGTAAGGGTNGLTTYTLATSQVTQGSCVKISAADFGNSLITRIPAPGTNDGTPLTATEAVKGCSGGSAGNKMSFEFSRD